MARAHRIQPTVPVASSVTAILGGATAADNLTWADAGKTVKLAGESRFDLTAAGDQIEGFISSVENATAAGRSYGGVVESGRFWVTFDGVQATPGTGTVAVGDYVVAGRQVAKNVQLTDGQPPKVCKATDQAAGVFKWRVVSLGDAGTGAVGTVGVIQRVS